MMLLRHRWLCAVLAVLLTAGAFAALWWNSVHAPDDAVREIPLVEPDWYLAEHRVAGKAYYTLRSARGNTPWDTRYGNRPGSWLYLQREGNALFLQRLDGSALELDLRTGAYHDAPTPSTPFTPLSALFPDI